MFRSSKIISALALNLAKVIFMLKHSVKLRRYLLCSCVATCYHVISPNFVWQRTVIHPRINNNLISPNVLT